MKRLVLILMCSATLASAQTVDTVRSSDTPNTGRLRWNNSLLNLRDTTVNLRRDIDTVHKYMRGDSADFNYASVDTTKSDYVESSFAGLGNTTISLLRLGSPGAIAVLPAEGWLGYDYVDHKLYYHNGTAQVEIGSGGGGSGTITGGTSLGGTAIYSGVSGANLTFKGLTAGSGVTVTSASTALTIGLATTVPRTNTANTFTSAQTITANDPFNPALSSTNAATTAAAHGVFGRSVAGSGVYGQATGSGTGVTGLSSTGTGGYFTSTSGIALHVEGNGIQSSLLVRTSGVNSLWVTDQGLVAATDADVTNLTVGTITMASDLDTLGDKHLAHHDTTGMSAIVTGAWVKQPDGTYTMEEIISDSSTSGFITKTNSGGTATVNSFLHEDPAVALEGGMTIADSTVRFSRAVYSYPDSILADNIIDWKKGNYFYKTIGGSTTFTFANGYHPGQTITVRITASGSYTASFPGTIVWAGGSAPTQTANKTDFYTFIYDMNGVVYGAARQNF